MFPSDKTLIIAEIGKGFIQTQDERPVEEYLANAKRLVDEAQAAGADAVKFQTHTVDDEQANIEVVSPHFKGSDRYRWVKRNTDATPFETFWKPLKQHCDEKGILFFSTPMSRGAAELLQKLDVPLWKVGSGDILDFVMLDFIRNTGKPIIISAGMSTLEETEKALNFLREKNQHITLLHCISRYPCPAEDLNIATMEFFRERFGVRVGFSDHSIGIESALVAVALGAQVIEKHFSLSRELWGSDHKVSMTPQELRDMVTAIRDMEQNPEKKLTILQTDFAKKAIGQRGKFLQDGEAVFRPLFRKSLVAAQDIPAGTLITKEMLHAMRPQQYLCGMHSEEYPNVVGKKAARNIQKGKVILWQALEK